MNLNFDIPTPKCCADCPFGYADKNDKSGVWAMRCLCDPNISQTFSDGRAYRNPDCPGTVDD